MARRRPRLIPQIIASVIAVLVAPVGLWLLLWAGASAFDTVNRTGKAPGFGTLALGVLGIALLIVVVQTAQVSSLGIAIVAVVFGLVSLVALVSSSAGLALERAATAGAFPLSFGLGFWLFAGFLLVFAALLGAAAIAIPRVRPAGTRGRVLSIVIAVVVTPIAFGMLAAGGSSVVNAALGSGGTAVIGSLLVVVAALLLAGVVLTAIASSAGLFVGGVLYLVLGLAGFVVPGFGGTVAYGYLAFGDTVAFGAQTAYLFGFVALLGAIDLSVAVVSRRRRAARIVLSPTPV
jgi:hypothetical protein